MWKKLAAVTLLSFVFLSSDLALARGSRGGHSSGGSGSSHKGGHYRNTRTNDHYQKRWRGFDVQLSWIHPTLPSTRIRRQRLSGASQHVENETRQIRIFALTSHGQILPTQQWVRLEDDRIRPTVLARVPVVRQVNNIAATTAENEVNRSLLLAGVPCPSNEQSSGRANKHGDIA